MAIRNANDGISLAQTAEGAIEETTSMLQRMRELSLQAANSVNNASDRAALDAEVQQLKTEIDRIATTTSFNGQKILDGSFSGKLQIGAQSSETMDLAISSIATTAMGETASGLAKTATKATLTVSGVSQNVADYSGVSFNASVNGVSKTVTLPTATPIETRINAAFVASDVTESFKPQQVGAFAERRAISLASHGDLKIAVNDGDTATFVVDVKAAATSLGYDLAKISGEKMVKSIQTAIDSSGYFVGNNKVTVGLDVNDNITFDVAGGAKKIVVADGNVGTLYTQLSGSSSGTVTGSTLSTRTLASPPADGSEIFGMQQFAITTADTNKTLKITIGAGTEVAVDLNTTGSNLLFDNMADVATHIQRVLDTSGAFQGANALTVSAVRNDNDEWGLTFVSGSGSKVKLAGNFMTTASGVGSTVNNSATILPAGTTELTLTPVKQFGQLAQKTIDLTAVLAADASTSLEAMKRFTMNVNGGGDVAISMTSAFTEMAKTETVTTTAITQDQFVRAMQTAINESGMFVGDNAVTVSVNDAGRVALSVAGGVGSIAVKETSDASATSSQVDGLIKALTGTNNGIIGNASESVASGGLLVFGTSQSQLVAAAGPINPPGQMTFTTSATNDAAALKLNLVDAYGNKTVITTAALDANATGAQLAASVNAAIAASTTDAGKVADLYTATGTGVSGSAVLTLKRKDGVDFTVQVDSTSATTLTLKPDTLGATTLVKGGSAVSSQELPQTFGLAKSVIGGGTGGTFETETGVLSGAMKATDTLSFDGYTFTLQARHAGDSDALRNLVIDEFVSGFNASGNTSWVASRSANSTLLMTATAQGNQTDVAITVGQVGASSAIATTSVTVDGTAATYNLENTLKLKVGSGSDITVKIAQSDTQYSSMAELQSTVQAAIDSTPGLQGANRVVVGVSTDSLTGKSGLTFTQASGQTLAVSGNFITGELRETLTSPWEIVTLKAGGIDLSADNTITVTVADADSGSSITKAITLGSSSANVTLADYTSLVQSGINAAFTSDGYSVSASANNGTFNLALDQAGSKTITVGGSSVTAALGGSKSATGANASAMNTMADVIAQINADLAGDAVVSYDAAARSMVFDVESGDSGVSSNIALSGAGLSAIQFGGSLSASGTAGEASAGRLSAITVTSVVSANAAILSIDNAIEYVNSQRASLGAIQNRLDHTVSNLTNIATNTEASRSRIMDADYGAESANLARSQIIQQAATAMLAQANQSAQSVLSLLQ